MNWVREVEMGTRLVGFGLILFVLSGCARPGGSATGGDATGQETAAQPATGTATGAKQQGKGTVTPESSARSDLERQVQEVFNKHCTRCHGRSGGLSLKKGQSFKNLINAKSKRYAPKLRVVPGKPEESVLYHKLIGTKEYGRRMPLNRTMPEENVELIKKWIESLEGAGE